MHNHAKRVTGGVAVDAAESLAPSPAVIPHPAVSSPAVFGLVAKILLRRRLARLSRRIVTAFGVTIWSDDASNIFRPPQGGIAPQGIKAAGVICCRRDGTS